MRSENGNDYIIRNLNKDEVHLLKDFLYEAIFIPEGIEPPGRDIVENPELRVYTDDTTPPFAISLYKEYRSKPAWRRVPLE